MLFLDSLGFFTSIALGFAPKDPLGLDFKPKQNFKKNLKTCLSRARMSFAERILDKFSRFSDFRKRPPTKTYTFFGGLGPIFRFFRVFLRRLRSVLFQKTPWGPITGQSKI